MHRAVTAVSVRVVKLGAADTDTYLLRRVPQWNAKGVSVIIPSG
jgi:hypothetical protein